MSDKPVIVDFSTRIGSSILQPIIDVVWDGLGENNVPGDIRSFIGAMDISPDDDVNYYIVKNRSWVVFDPNSITISWGDITGSLSVQTDLQDALDSKVSKTTPVFEANITLGTYGVNSDGTLISGAELRALSGVTSAIQNQINSKIGALSDDTSPTLAGTLTLDGYSIDAGGSYISPTEMSRLDGVSDNIQTQLNGKIGQLYDDTNPQLHGTLDVNGYSVYVNGVYISPSEFSALDGVSSAIQTQLNAKADLTLSNISNAATARNNIGATGNLLSVSVYTSSATHTFNSSTKKWIAEVVGGGGGGGGPNTVPSTSYVGLGGGGGGGGYGKSLFTTVPSSVTVTVGAGGAGGTASGGSNGGTSSCNGLSAAGGGGGTALGATAKPYTSAVSGGDGGGCSTGNIQNSYGEFGGFGLALSDRGVSGGGGSSIFGGGGKAVNAGYGGSSNGFGSHSYGAGGGGAIATGASGGSLTGGNGGSGIVIIWEFN